MRKNIKFIIGVLVLLIMPVNIYAASDVASDLKIDVCTSTYQDKFGGVTGTTNFSSCMKAVCRNNRFTISYNNSSFISGICANGNTSPFRDPTKVKNGCLKYEYMTPCNEGAINYCSKIEYVDCSKRADGTSFGTTTTRRSTTKYRPTSPITQAPTTTTTTVAPGNTKLKSIVLSTGTIPFSPDTYNYTLTIDAIVNSIDVTALPQDSSSTVKVEGNTNLKDGSAITIIVTGKESNKSTYVINIKKKEKVTLSNNTKLKSLTIKDYPIDFNSRTNNYNLVIKDGVTSLQIDYVPEDSEATVMITGNDKLVSGSKITITVTAPDGSVGYYTLNITVKKKSNFLKILFIIVMIMAILVGGYYIYKKFIATRSEDKYEYE